MRRATGSLTILGLLLIGAAPSAGQNDDADRVLGQIFADWKARQESFASIYVEISGEDFHPKGRFDDDYRTDPDRKKSLSRLGSVPPTDVRHPTNVKLLLEFDKNWARKEWKRMSIFHPSAKFAPQHTTYLSNGESIKVYEPRDQNTSSSYTPSKAQPDLWIQSTAFGGAFFANEDIPIFWGCGIVWISAVNLKHLRFALEPRNYLFKGFAEIDGRRCVVLSSPNLLPKSQARYEFWVDPDRNSAILRSQFILDGKVSHQTNVKWQELEGKWFPSSWRFDYFWNDKNGTRLDHSVNLRVDRVVFNQRVTAADFDVTLKPNMVVRDVPKDAHGVVGSDGKSLLPLSTLDNDNEWRLWHIILLTMIALAVVFLAGWYLRRRWVLRATR